MIKRGDLVRINKGTKVYRVATVQPGEPQPYYLETISVATHPDAAARLGDAFRWYDEVELTPVEPQCPWCGYKGRPTQIGCGGAVCPMRKE